MRITSGQYKGRRLVFPDSIRPTQDKVRQALFNVLGAKIVGARVLDLFAGSGAYGLEALSRGAGFSVFIDNAPLSIKAINANIENAKASADAVVYKNHCDRAIEILSGKGELFDVVFADPPYYKELAKKTLIKLTRYDILAANSVIIFEHSKHDLLPERAENLVQFTQKTYGDVVLSFYRKHPGAETTKNE